MLHFNLNLDFCVLLSKQLPTFPPNFSTVFFLCMHFRRIHFNIRCFTYFDNNNDTLHFMECVIYCSVTNRVLRSFEYYFYYSQFNRYVNFNIFEQVKDFYLQPLNNFKNFLFLFSLHSSLSATRSLFVKTYNGCCDHDLHNTRRFSTRQE